MAKTNALGAAKARILTLERILEQKNEVIQASVTTGALRHKQVVTLQHGTQALKDAIADLKLVIEEQSERLQAYDVSVQNNEQRIGKLKSTVTLYKIIAVALAVISVVNSIIIYLGAL